MGKTQRVRGKAMSMPVGVALGVGAALGWTVLGAMIAGKLVDMEKLPMDKIGYASLVILLTASFLGAVVAYSKVKRQRAAVMLAAGGGYYLGLLAMTAMFFGGQYSAMGVTALLVLAGCGTALLLEMYGKPRDKSGTYTKRVRKIVQTDHR